MAKLSVIKESNNFIVSQSNDLVEANYSKDLTVKAHIVARLIFSLISPNDSDLQTYTIKIDALKKYLGLSGSAKWGAFYSRLKETAKVLNEKPIEIKKPNGDILVASYISSYEISPEKGTVEFEISNKLRPYLLKLKKNYTSYLLAYIPKLKSTYSVRLYELLHQYRQIGNRTFKLEDLQKKVGSNYPVYSNFKIKVLNQAQKELKQHTDLAFTFNEHKTGRKVTSIEFIIFGNKPPKKQPDQLSFLEDAIEINDNIEAPAYSDKIIEKLNSLGISEQNISKYVAKGFDIITEEEKRAKAIERCSTIGNYYLEKLELLKNSPSAQAKGNSAGFLIQALKQDWSSSKSVQKFKVKEQAKKIREAKAKIKHLELKVDKINKKIEKVNQPILAGLMEDEAILNDIYSKAMAEMGSFVKNTLSKILSLPIKEQYKKSVFVESSMNLIFYTTFPEKFTESSKLEEMINETRKEVEVLKKEFRL